ncbi:hypothetical protein NDU88_007794 [Pleurodeles waltl]|uniref:Uncharacterized protein n=1 Tax=Pleurodeles waltl TaxID=8319 RepID=A0AAV7NB89_PLEWA|nr:hypothetical protein NDU88_007794 [Pleurodeles waltl]
MASKPIRTPRSFRARQSQDPGGTRKDKKHPAPGLKEHSNPHAKGPQQRISDIEKDARNSVPTMFASMMRTKQMPPEKVARDSQSIVPGVDGRQVSVAAISLEVRTPICDAGGMEPASLETTSASPGNSREVVGPPLVRGEKSSEQEPKELKEGFQEPNPGKCNVQSRTLTNEALAQQDEGMVKHLTIRETVTPASAQRGKEAILANSNQGPFDTAESFFSLSDQSRDSDLDEEIPLTDSDIEGSSAASIWVSNYSTCRRKSFEQTGSRYNSGLSSGGNRLILKKRWPCEDSLVGLIYRTMVHNHEQAQKESRKVKLANRQLQLAIKKVAKSYQDIGTRNASMETRTEELETEVRAATAQTATQEQQISDIQWKLEDAENRQRLNNLRILEIAEDLEGQDTRAYIVSLFKKAFPNLTGWDWEKEVQRAHRFPLMRKKQTSTTTGRDQSYPRAIIVYFGNFLLRQVVFERTRPNSKLTVEGVSFFTRPDFAHATVEGRWRLRQIIAQFQELGAEAYLLSPSRLKDDLVLLVKKWDGRVGAKEAEVCESMEMARTVLLSAGPQAQHFMVLYNLLYIIHLLRFRAGVRWLVLLACDVAARKQIFAICFLSVQNWQV